MRFLIGGFLSFFEARPPLLSLGPISLLTGVAILWVFRRVGGGQDLTVEVGDEAVVELHCE